MSYQQRNPSYRDDVDIDRIVDNSYGFLSDMHGGDTLPRKTAAPAVNVVSWNDRNDNRSISRGQPKVRYWEPRLKSVRDIPQELLPPSSKPRQRYPNEQQSYAQSNQRLDNYGNDRQNQRYDEPKMTAPNSQYGHASNSQYSSAPNSQYGPTSNSQYDSAPTRQHGPAPNSQYGPASNSQYAPNRNSQYSPAPKSQYVPTPKAPENWKKPLPPDSTFQQRSHAVNPNSNAGRSRWEDVNDPNNRIVPASGNQSEEDDYSRKGSSLLQRTNHYLDAVGRINNDENKEIAYQPQPVEKVTKRMTTFVPDVATENLPGDSCDKSEKRKSIAERIGDLNKSVGPPPPPLPPPISEMPTVTPNSQTGRPQLSYIAQIKNGRQTLRSVKKIMEAPDQTNQPEPKNLGEKLNRLLQLQLQGRHNPPKHYEENPKNVNQTDKYNTVKTLSKAAMKDKLEYILQDGPPKKPSFRGANDLGVRREAINKLRSTESRAVDTGDHGVSRPTSYQNGSNISSNLSRQPSIAEEFHVCHACGSKVPTGRKLPSDVSARQKVLMENVFATIKLKGRMADDSHL